VCVCVCPTVYLCLCRQARVCTDTKKIHIRYHVCDRKCLLISATDGSLLYYFVAARLIFPKKEFLESEFSKNGLFER
jgi:hypothetical protein